MKDKKKDIYYTLSKHGDNWHVWKNVDSARGWGVITIFESSYRKECIKYCNENKIKIRGGIQ